jgi:SAM-dependent methyltransferase
VGMTPPTQYATDAKLRARQRLWDISPAVPAFSLFPWVLGLAHLEGGERILEAGCGNGGYLARVDAIGMDVSVGMLAAARRQSGGPLVCGDAQRIPFRDQRFDVVLAPHMLYHVEDRRAAAKELRRVLAADGVCIAVTNGEQNHAEMVRLVEDVVGHGWRWRRPERTAFSLENGAEQLGAGFQTVERVDAPAGVVSVHDVDALAAYVDSVGDIYEPDVAAWTSWDEVVQKCRRRAAEIIENDGAFTISKSVGAFVCR